MTLARRFRNAVLSSASVLAVCLCAGDAAAAGLAASSIAPGLALVVSPAWLFGIAISAPMVLLVGGVAAVMATDHMN